ncbi:hypothetical protein [Pyxidicoccus sp. MSG2]|uniref:hypothetical protein n=1 Tax=Pyxidicoccus sp. MSG2 TaxID=2996790 RepID=UPI002271541F|nr:hypothetical protein [Pyxidicoccus sp. MSG2]MCY1021945.1 hypothetical protein [Pyxidicoccus sp. MSG2]
MLPGTMRWVIRSEQQRALGGLAADSFVEDAATRLRRHWPAACAALGDAGLEVRIRHGMTLAARFDIHDKAAVLRYLNAMFALGDGFASDARYPWAAELLGHPRLDEHERMARVSAEVAATLRAGEVKHGSV